MGFSMKNGRARRIVRNKSWWMAGVEVDWWIGVKVDGWVGVRVGRWIGV